jgi:hypothetical protein
MTRVVASAAAVALVMSVVARPAFAQSQTRLTDKQVEKMLEESQQALNRFIDGMNPQMRTAVLTSETSQINVKLVLDDFKDAAKKMRDRYNPPNYSANTEVVTFLRQAKAFDRGIALRPGMSGADAKWSDVVPVARRLADAYQINWDTDPSYWVAGRVSDGELKKAIETARKQSDSLRKDVEKVVKKDTSLDAAGKKAANDRMMTLATATKDLEELTKRSADPTAAATRVVTAAAGVKGFLGSYSGGVEFMSRWNAIDGAIDTVARAYGVKR